MRITHLLILPFILIFILSSPQVLPAQFEIGYTSGLDLYQRYKNPSDDLAYPAAGNTFLSVNAGPKIWVGSPAISFSLEAQANWGILSLALKDYKGLGSVSFPILAKLNFKALSGMTKDFGAGWAIGGGIAYSKTELYYLSQKYRDLGVQRSFFPTYIIELNFGGGGYANIGYIYLRYGLNFDSGANVLNIGIMSDKVYSRARSGKPVKEFSSPYNYTDLSQDILMF